ncbi:MAG: hypothetical protein SH819_04515 [Cytophagales bacterium]|nr:hypothetical protein [Cytophagales bacterium]
MKRPTEEPPVKARPSVDLDVLAAIHPELFDDSHIYVHCHIRNQWQDMLIRIWRATFLLDRESGSRSTLVHAENITYAPVWTLVPDGKSYSFLLIFGALPKTCTLFDLVEETAGSGGFYVSSIPRNERDVYHVNLL